MLASISVDYYAKMERGDLRGVAPEIVDAVARALLLDEAETDHLHDLARAADPRPPARRAPRADQTVRPSLQRFLDAVTGAPAWVRDRRMDMITANALGRALYRPVLDDADGRGNTARFMFLSPAARNFFPDWERSADDIVATMRTYAGQHPRDRRLTDLVGELATRSDAFRARWGPAPPHRRQTHPPSRRRRPRARLRGDGPAGEPGLVHVRLHRRARQPHRRPVEAAGQPRGHAARVGGARPSSMSRPASEGASRFTPHAPAPVADRARSGAGVLGLTGAR